ncbi:MAG: hypothetical protein R3283_04700 [Balneolaceae bacterium]|nr:hypothetical protein [Balneolaceae bacterium]
MQKTSGFSIWLLPDETSSNLLSAAIESLSKSLSSPLFLPHITLASVPSDSDSEILLDNLDQFASDRQELIVRAKDLICGKPPFQRYYLLLKESETLQQFSETMDSLLGGNYSRKTNYHISLYYGFESCDEIRVAYDHGNMDLPNEMYIQSIALVNIDGYPEEWEILGQRKLSSRNAE